jgi:2-polyprenyl-3-methyl-5-hydroxy-6-metoxy-1,4-benzoquinol methylase
MPDDQLFELSYSPEWGYERKFFLDVEHRYTKMHRLLRERYGDLSGKRIVDLGLSRGLLLERFRRYEGAELGGIEIDPAEIEHARARGLEPLQHFVNAFDGNVMTAQLPYEDASADVVLAGEILEHLVDTEGFLREIRRTLVPGGGLVLSTPNIFWPKHRVRLLAGRYPDALEYRSRYGADFGHVRIFGSDQLRELLDETGFVDVAVIGNRIGSISTLASGPAPVARLLDRLADRYPAGSETLIAFARRARVAGGEG